MPTRPVTALIACLGLGLAAPASVTAQESPGRGADPPPPRAIVVGDDEKPPAARPVRPAPEEEGEPAEPKPVRKIAPGPEGDLFTYANLLYSKKQHDLAIRQYRKYLDSYPAGMHAEESWYRLGESLLNDGQVSAAEDAYRTLVRNFRSGDFTGYAAYRLGALAYTREDYYSAIPHLRTARATARTDDLKLAATYYQARCLQLTGKTREAVPLYETLASHPEERRFWQKSLLALGRLDSKAGRDDEALARYQALVESGATLADTRAEALVQAGLILAGRGDSAGATTYFDQALKLTGTSEWKPIARYGLIENHYRAKEYEQVIGVYIRTTDLILPEDTRPKMLLMVANSYRYLKQYNKATDLYLVIETYYPNRPEGAEAAYNKLVSAYNLGDPSLPRFVDQFVEKQRARDRGSELIDQALLLKAELLFKNEVYDRAGDAYGEVRIDKLPEALRATTLYRCGYAQVEGGNAVNAVSTFTEFLDRFPTDLQAPYALAKRGLAYKTLEDTAKAIVDFQRVIDDYPESPPVELAYQQAALLKGQTRDFEGMVTLFQELLAEFPESRGAAEAYYWIGEGQFEQKKYEDCVPNFEEARRRDPEEYVALASIKIILAHYYLQNVDELTEAIDRERRRTDDTVIPAAVVGWLGLKHFEAGDYLDAERFLMMASTPESPNQTRAHVWDFLGRSRLKLGKYEPASQAFTHYLASATRPADRARGLLAQGTALLGARQFDDATAAANEGLELQKQGQVNARLWILLGDIAFARGDYDDAVKKYIVPSQFFVDPRITPEALSKSAEALEKLGQTAKAEEILNQLATEHPDFDRSSVPAGSAGTGSDLDAGGGEGDGGSEDGTGGSAPAEQGQEPAPDPDPVQAPEGAI